MAINFEFPAWLREQHSFADSLLKGAQVGSMIANARYRNQALAVQAEQANKEYALREKQLASQQRTADLNFNLQSDLIEEESKNKSTFTEWIQERGKLPLEERMSMADPPVTLPKYYEMVNKVRDNDRLTFQHSLAGKAQTALALRLGKIDADYVQQYLDEPDPARKREILVTGEAAAAAKAEALRAVAPTIAAESRERLAKFRAATQEQLVNLRGNIDLMRDQLRADAALDLEGERQLGRLDLLDRRYEKLEGLQEDSQEFKTEFAKLQNDLGVVRDSLKPQRGSHYDLPYSKQILMKSELDEVNQLLKTYEIDPAEASKRRAAIEAKYVGTSTAPASKAPPTVGEVRGGYKFLGGDPALPSSWEKLP